MAPKRRSTATHSEAPVAGQTVAPIPGNLVAQAYRWETDQFIRYQIWSDGSALKFYRVGSQGQWAPQDVRNSLTIKGINRIDVFSTTKARLLRVDVIQGSSSSVTVNRTSATFEARVRNVLWTNEEQAIPLKIVLGFSGTAVVPTKFEVGNQPFSVSGGLEGVLTRTVEAPAPLFGASGFTDFIGLVPSVPATTHPNLRVSFVPLADLTGYIEDKGRVIKFTRAFVGFALLSKVKELRAFDNPNGTLTFKNPGLTLVQQPSREIAGEPKRPAPDSAPASKWIVHVDAIPFSGVADLWNGFTDLYYRGLRTVEGGRPTSFLPNITNGDTGGRTDWALAYSLIDALPETSRNPGYRFSEDPAASSNTTIQVAGLSLQPRCSDLFNASLKQLTTHENSGVSIKFQGVTGDATPGCTINDSRFEEPEYRGIVFPLGNLIRSTMVAKVRMGSLDLRFAGETSADQPLVNTNPGGKPKALTYFFRIVPRQDVFSVHINASFAIAKVSPGGQDDVPLTEAVPDGGGTDAAGLDCTLSLDDNDKAFDPRNPTFELQNFEARVEQHFRRTPPLVVDLGDSESQTNGSPARFVLEVTEDAQEFGSQTVEMTLKSQAGSDSERTGSVVVLDSNPFLVAKVVYPAFLAQSISATVAEWRNRGFEGANWEIVSRGKPFELYLPPQGIGEGMEKEKTLSENVPIDFRLSPPAQISLKAAEQQKNLTEVPWNLRRILGYPGQRNPGAGIVHLQFELLYGLSCDVKYPFLRLAEIAALVGAIPGRLPPTPRWSEANHTGYLQARRDWAILYRRCLARLAVFQPWDTHRLPEEFKASDPPEHDLLLNSDVVCRIRSDKNTEDKPRAELADPFNPDSTNLRGGVTWGFESGNVYNVVRERPTSDDATVTDPSFSSLGGWGKLRASFNNNLTKVYADVAMGRTYSYKLERLGRIAVWWNLAKHVIVYERTVVPAIQMDKQNKLLGRPVLRKVREYIEILEDTRSYPDGKNPAAIPPAQSGCVKACTFDKKEFDVQSSWGCDIDTTGWKIPLWSPGASPALYPKPEVTLEVMSLVAGKTSKAPWVICNPQNLHFYTETKLNSNPDPHEWLPVDDLDFVDFPMCKPLEDFEQGRAVITTPDDPSVHPGYGPCTFELLPGPGTADIVSGRSAAGQPMVALLKNVTMMRARLADAPTQKLSGLAEDLLRLREDAVAVYQKILAEAPSDLAVYAAQRERLKTIGQNEINHLTEVLNRVKDAGNKFSDRMKAREEELKNLLQEQFKTLQKEVKKGYDDALARVTSIDELKLAAGYAVNTLQEKLLLLRLSPGLLPRLARRYYEAGMSLQDELTRRAKEIKDQLPATATITGNQLAVLQNNVRQLVARGDELLQGISQQRPPEDWLPDLSSTLKAAGVSQIKQLQDEYQERRQRLTREILDKSQVLRADAVMHLAALQQWLVPPLPPVPFPFQVLGEMSLPILENWVKDKIAGLEAFRAVLLTSASGELDAAKTRIATQIDAELERLEKELTKETDGPIARVVGQVESLKVLAIQDLTAGLPKFDQGRLNDAIDLGRREIEAHRDALVKSAEEFVQKTVRLALDKLPSKPLSFADPGMSIRLLRAFGEAPEVKNLEFPGRKEMAYFYRSIEGPVEMTRALARVTQASDVSKALQPIGIDLPTKQVLDRLVPPDLRNFNLSEIFPDFAGLSLSNLFQGLRMPDTGDNVRITHGIDTQSGKAWVETNVNVLTKEPATVFTIGPVVLRLPSARFEAKVRIEAGKDKSMQRTVQGSIRGDFDLIIADMLVVKFKDTTLSFDDRGGLRFNLSPKNVVLPEILSFVSEFLGAVGGSDSGFSVKLLADGVEALLSLPVPDTASVTSGIANLKLGVAFRLNFDPEFKISIIFSLGRHDSPFTITGFLLGGAGYIEVTTSYTPALRRFGCQVEIAVAMSGSVAIAVGPINGGVYIYFGIKQIYRRETNGGDNSLTMGAFLLFIGKVQLLGLVEVEISELLEVRYTKGKLTGHGRLALKIKICWCFTLEVSADLEYTLGEGAKTSTEHQTGAKASQRQLVAHHASALAPPAATSINFYKWARAYIDLLV
jgi:hypothetical protein